MANVLGKICTFSIFVFLSIRLSLYHNVRSMVSIMYQKLTTCFKIRSVLEFDLQKWFSTSKYTFRRMILLIRNYACQQNISFYEYFHFAGWRCESSACVFDFEFARAVWDALIVYHPGDWRWLLCSAWYLWFQLISLSYRADIWVFKRNEALLQELAQKVTIY